MQFRDRADAGQRLGRALQRLAGLTGTKVVVLGLPRGGVVVAAEVAAALHAPLDVILVRKLGAPFQPELAMGAVGEGGVRVLDERLISSTGLEAREVEIEERTERAEIERQAHRFRGERPPVSLSAKTALVVDDGLATGATAKVACQVCRARGAAKILLAVPVAPPGWERRVGADANECVALVTPEGFFAIGEYYRDFSQTTDEQVARLLEDARRRHSAEEPPPI